MKSLKDISWLVSEEEYRKDPAYSYSTLAKFAREGFNNLSHLFDRVESPSLTFGSMVDSLITGGQDEFDSRFLVADFPVLPDSQRCIVDSLFQQYNSEFSSIHYPNLADVPDSAIIALTEVQKFQLNWKPETRAKVIKENGKDYWDLMFLANDRKIVSQKDYEDAMNCVETLKTSKSTKLYFMQDNPFNTDVEHLYQLKFKGDYEGIPVRCMMDLAIVLHKEKTIIPCDLKTSSKPEWDFPKSFVDWSYMIQAQLYSYILKQNLGKDEYFKDFKITPYRFIVVNRRTLTPLVWTFEQTFSDVGCTLGDVKYKGWREYLLQLDYYLKNSPKVPQGIDLERYNSIERYYYHD